jgi:hypothetical protein
MLLYAHVSVGNYAECRNVMREWLRDRDIGEPLTHLVPTLVWFSISTILTGEWPALDEIRPLVAEAIDSMGSSANRSTLAGLYFDLLAVALARDDRAAIDAAATVLERLLSNDQSVVDQTTFSALLQGDPALIDFDSVVEHGGEWTTHNAALISNEYGVPVPERLLTYLRKLRERPGIADAIPPTIAITEAIAAGDTAALARAIDEAERHQLIPHAARVRIVLAEMSGDPAPLEQARPVLERLQDRQFLRRLEEVAGHLESSGRPQTTHRPF